MQQNEVVTAINQLCFESHETAKEKGWWDERQALIHAATRIGGDSLGKFATATIKGGLIALIHSEASEVLEGIRNETAWDDKVPEFTPEEAELADILIRVFDMAGAFKLRLGEALVAKMEMNATRSHKHGGKVL